MRENRQLKDRFINKNERGFSLIELIIVLLILSIMSVFALMSFRGDKKYLADSQAYKMIDMLHEARQRALTQHVTMRVEINKTKNVVRIINENAPGTAADDQQIKVLNLQEPQWVIIDKAPKNIAAAPSEMFPVPPITFKTSVHPLSNGDSVVTLRFLTNGTVMDAGSNAIGTNAVVTGATIYVWMPDYNQAGQPLETGNVIRAITLLGSTGASKYLKCPIINAKCTEWTQ